MAVTLMGGSRVGVPRGGRRSGCESREFQVLLEMRADAIQSEKTPVEE
jgi:hypothetical protein